MSQSSQAIQRVVILIIAVILTIIVLTTPVEKQLGALVWVLMACISMIAMEIEDSIKRAHWSIIVAAIPAKAIRALITALVNRACR